MSLSFTVDNVNLILKKDTEPILVCMVINFNKLSDKNKFVYSLKREEKLKYQKTYNEENKEKYLSYQKDYYDKRREKLLEEKKEKVLCECGTFISYGNLIPHKKTSLHKKRLINKNQPQ